MKLAEFKNQWNNISLAKCFEMAVINKKTNESDYVTFDVSIGGRSFIAHHEPLNTKQSKSKKVAFVKQVIDLDFGIDSNLQELYEHCVNAICESEYFDLKD